MKGFFIFVFAVLISSACFAQDLTGIWRGTFNSGIGPFQQMYKYEVQIDQQKNLSLQGVTYSYRTTVFYGKATFEGIWFPKTKSVLVKELKLIEVRMAGGSDACAMTCNLDYSKEDGKEILQGTFTSVNINSKTDCGSGTVYLEKVPESDFHKEDFLLKKKSGIPSPDDKISPGRPSSSPDIAKKNAKKIQNTLGIPADGIAGPKTMSAISKKVPSFDGKIDFNDTDEVNDLIDQIKKSTVVAPKVVAPKPAPTTTSENDIAKANARKLQRALGIPADGTPGPKTLAALKNKLPGYTGQPNFSNTTEINKLVDRVNKANASVKQPPVTKNDTVAKTPPPEIEKQEPKTPSVTAPALPVPEVLRTRSNPLVKTIETNSADIKIELYDNGDIDGDTITVYHNNQVIAWKKGLTSKPVTLNIKADDENTVHEFVMVADNLGSIPPNTALMIITTGGKRYQLFISSDKQKNAKVIIEYIP